MDSWTRKLWGVTDHPPTNPGCFVIPSYALKDRSLPNKPTRAQIDRAIAWWKKFPNAKLIMCTGDNQGLGVSNAAVMARYALNLGVPRENILEEDRSLNTYQNLLYSMEIIKEQNLSRPTLVTLDLYTKRAVLTARKLGWKDFYWISVFSAGQPAHGIKWLQTHSRFTIFCYETGAMLYSKIRGWI